MNTRASENSASRGLALVRSVALSPLQLESAALLLICLTLSVGAFLCFPLYDDGWMALVLRESGPRWLAQHMGDRPFVGFLLERVASFGPANRLVFVILNAVLWLVFAIESLILFRELFPEFKDYSMVAACLTLAPIVLQTQLSTAVVVIPANLATILGYASILVLLWHGRAYKAGRPLLVAAAATLAALAVALSEYGVATNLVGSAILIGVALASSGRETRRRLLLSAVWLFALTVAAYLIFTKLADFSARPDISPAQMVHRGAAKWLEVPFDVLAGAWHALIGAYATAFGTITFAWDSKSTLVGSLCGLLVAILLGLAIQRRRAGISSAESVRRLAVRAAFLLPSVLVGLVPFRVMGRPTTLLEFGSRFRIPIMPVAGAITLVLILGLVRPALRWIPVAMFGLLIGYASWTFTYNAIEQSRSIAALETALKPYVARAGGFTVAIVPFNRFESELTANISSTWPVDLEKRLWVVGVEPARTQFGNRNTCRPKMALDTHVRGLARAGKLDQLLWVEAPPGRPVSIEPYCLTQNDNR